MKNTWKALIIGGALLAGFTATASARDNVSFALSFGVPAYTYVAPPPPVYYAPPPVYYAPPPPRVVYYAPPPAFGFTVYDRHWHGHHRGHGHHGRHHRHR